MLTLCLKSERQRASKSSPLHVYNNKLFMDNRVHVYLNRKPSETSILLIKRRLKPKFSISSILLDQDFIKLISISKLTWIVRIKDTVTRSSNSFRGV
jgi:hypothetical protein